MKLDFYSKAQRKIIKKYTTSATGRFFILAIGAIAQMEREIKAERAYAGRE